MWWGSIKNSALVWLFFGLMGCKDDRDVAKIYLASSLMPISQDIENFFKDRMAVDLMYMSSSALARHIEQGAPCDVAIVADDEWRRYLQEKNAVEPQVEILAKNGLAVVSHRATSRHGVRELLDEQPQKIIIADPDFVPLGSYTKEALESLRLLQKLTPQFLRAHSARQAVLLFEQSVAPVAILYQSDAINFPHHAIFHPSLYRPIHYPFLVCKKADSRRADRLKTLCFSDQFQKILIQKGFLSFIQVASGRARLK